MFIDDSPRSLYRTDTDVLDGFDACNDHPFMSVAVHKTIANARFFQTVSPALSLL